jgi:DNA-directed RNA polymerase II subunit RPB2
MPFTSDGVRPDLIINPHALPSRMTIGQLTESLFGKVCSMYGGFGDSTAFEVKGPNTELYGKMLTEVGFHSSGNQLLYNGMTGERIQSEIFIGPTYYLRLKHMVKDKINYRSKGPNTALTRQPVQGRSNDGGLRIGEMEKDAIIAHGASKFLNDSFMKRSDEYYMAICNISGCVAVYNPSLNLFLSPFVDGPLVFHEGLDNKQLHLDNISRFGRNFSILRIPYSLKLLIQELLVMNIQMRFITEDNIDQFITMSYSNNINKLLHKREEDLDKVIHSFKEETLRKKKEMDSDKYITQQYQPFYEKDIDSPDEPYQILTESKMKLDIPLETGEIDETYKSPVMAPYSPALTGYSPVMPPPPDKEDEVNLDDLYKFPEEFRSYYVNGYDAELIPSVEPQIQEPTLDEEVKHVESDIDYNALLNTPKTPEVKNILDVKEKEEDKEEDKDKKESTTKSFKLN